MCKMQMVLLTQNPQTLLSAISHRYKLDMDEDVKKKLDFLHKRIGKIERFLESLNFSAYTPSDFLGQDELFEQAVKIVCAHDRASSSLLQRRMSVGFNRAARLLEQLEEAGVVGPAFGAAPREVLVKDAESFLKNHKPQQ